MKFATDRPYADPEKAARKLIEIANAVEAIQDGRIFIELINAPFLYQHKASPAEYKAGLDWRYAGATPQRRTRVQSGSQRNALGEAEIEERPVMTDIGCTSPNAVCTMSPHLSSGRDYHPVHPA
jgi:hypothetical protein